jgi:hypothetical protein
VRDALKSAGARGQCFRVLQIGRGSLHQNTCAPLLSIHSSGFYIRRRFCPGSSELLDFQDQPDFARSLRLKAHRVPTLSPTIIDWRYRVASTEASILALRVKRLFIHFSNKFNYTFRNKESSRPCLTCPLLQMNKNRRLRIHAKILRHIIILKVRPIPGKR